ncbi:MAG: helicase C-terminal domain-containing protein, partial [Myxococcota bacterium]|nr:helicase C-terminal domain-containing protein [Myxococcota bacterium]
NNKRVFFATARTTQQLMAEQTVEKMAKMGLPIRAVSIRAKEKICLNEQVNCSPEYCPYAAGYYDKLQERDLLQVGWRFGESSGDLWPDKIIVIAEENYVCPYAYSLDMASLADLIIGDYNYLFDPQVRLNLISSQAADWIIVLDEAHNLPERAMGYGSPKIPLKPVWNALCRAESKAPKFAPPMRRLYQVLAETLSGRREREWYSPLDDFDKDLFKELVSEVEGLAIDYALQQLSDPLFTEGEEDDWLQSAYRLFRFQTMLSAAGDETLILWKKGFRDRNLRSTSRSLFEVRYEPRDDATEVSLLNRDPAVLLKPVFSKFAAAIIMSATLEPMNYYQDMLGLEESHTSQIRYLSTFPPENSAAYIVSHVSTAYRDRERDKERSAQLLSEIILNTPGNIALYFPSFAFLKRLFDEIDFGDRTVLVQHKSMREHERQKMISTMMEGKGHVLCAVMGGIFAEGVDLPGEALICAVMVGPALPQASLARRLLQEWNQRKYGKGFEYAWIVPGMARVSQAAGRVIRNPNDRGTVILLGRRFLQNSFQKFLPMELETQTVKEIGVELRSFWGENDCS